jgi:putative OPT family oligopeptide transporter
VQTGASAGSSIATGVIFTVPALVILGYWQDFKYGWVLAIAGLGGLLGVLFSVPLRRSMIVEQNLAFPEGKAAAEVLKAGEGQGSVKVLAGAGLLGGFGKLAAASGLRLIPDSASISAWFGKGVAYLGTNLSPALLGVGYIVGVNIGIVIAAGGVIAWNVAIPVWLAYLPRQRSRARGHGRPPRRHQRRIRDVVREDPLPRCRRDADGRALDDLRIAQARC